jgi:hypothetical protein
MLIVPHYRPSHTLSKRLLTVSMGSADVAQDGPTDLRLVKSDSFRVHLLASHRPALAVEQARCLDRVSRGHRTTCDALACSTASGRIAAWVVFVLFGPQIALALRNDQFALVCKRGALSVQANDCQLPSSNLHCFFNCNIDNTPHEDCIESLIVCRT